MRINTTQPDGPMQTIDMAVDLSGGEILAVYALALVGMATMSQRVENARIAIGQIHDLDIDPQDAKSALKKIQSGIALSVMAVPEGGLS